MNVLLKLWKDHGTKILGTVSFLNGIIPALLAINGLIPETQVKYWLAAAAIAGALTVKRGFTNSQTLNQGN